MPRKRSPRGAERAVSEANEVKREGKQRHGNSYEPLSTQRVRRTRRRYAIRSKSNVAIPKNEKNANTSVNVVTITPAPSARS